MRLEVHTDLYRNLKPGKACSCNLNLLHSNTNEFRVYIFACLFVQNNSCECICEFVSLLKGGNKITSNICMYTYSLVARKETQC